MAKSINNLFHFSGFLFIVLMMWYVKAYGRPLIGEDGFLKEGNLADSGIVKCTFDTNKMKIACFDKSGNKMLIEKV